MPYRPNGSDDHLVSETVKLKFIEFKRIFNGKLNKRIREEILWSYNNDSRPVCSKYLGNLINFAQALSYNSFVYWEQNIPRMFDLKLVPREDNPNMFEYQVERTVGKLNPSRGEACLIFQEKYGPDKNMYAEWEKDLKPNEWNSFYLISDNREKWCHMVMNIKTNSIKTWPIKEFIDTIKFTFGEEIYNWIDMQDLYGPNLDYVVRDTNTWIHSKKRMSLEELNDWLKVDMPRVDILLHALAEQKIIPHGKYILTR